MKIKHVTLIATLIVFPMVSTISSVYAEIKCGEESAFTPMYWKCQTAPLIVVSMLTVMEPILDGFTDDDIAQLNAACKENPESSGCKEIFNQVINKVLSDTNKKLPDEIKKNVDLLLKDIKQDPLHARFYSKAAEFPPESNSKK